VEGILGRMGSFPVPQGVEFREVSLWSGREVPGGVPLALRMIDY
jgi:hypothetical protein